MARQYDPNKEQHVSGPPLDLTPGPVLDLRTLMAVMAKAIFLLPSMFVLRTRRMCWNFSGMTRD